MDIITKRGRGRPKIAEPNNIQLKGWISKKEQDMLEHMLMESDKSKSELLRKMVRIYYHTHQGNW